jgi:hypothetical protein
MEKELSVFCKISKWGTVRELGLAGQNEKRVRQPWEA